MEQVAGLWNKINYIEVHGTLPTEQMITTEERKDIKALDKAKLLELRNNSLRPGVSRYKRLMSQCKKAERRTHYENLMNQYQIQLTEVENRLKEL